MSLIPSNKHNNILSFNYAFPIPFHIFCICFRMIHFAACEPVKAHVFVPMVNTISGFVR